MIDVKTSEETILADKETREHYMNRLDVLDKVKQVLLIPEMECLTIRQVADYFEVDIDTLKKCYKRNETEINTDGVVLKTPADIANELKGQDVPLVKTQTKLIVNFDNNVTLEIPNRGIRVFSKRAVLRIAMLLRIVR